MRRSIESCFEAAKREVGLDAYEVWRRNIPTTRHGLAMRDWTRYHLWVAPCCHTHRRKENAGLQL